VTEKVVNQARQLFIEVYSGKKDNFKGPELLFFTYMLLNSKLVLIKVRYTTEAAFWQNLQRAAYTKTVDKNDYNLKSNLPPLFRWNSLTKKAHNVHVPSNLPPMVTQMLETHIEAM